MSTPHKPRSSAPQRRRPGRPPGSDPRHGERREAILEGACRAILERGFPATRIADVAAAAGVSTGTVHYYFATKDDVLIAALKWASTRLLARVEEEADAHPTRRLAQLLALSVPSSGENRDGYVLWIELWLRVLHQPGLLADCEAISRRWREHFFAIVREGTERGDFTPVRDADEVADRLVALVDGLGFETVLGYRWTSPERMHERLIAFASEQLRVPISALALPA